MSKAVAAIDPARVRAALEAIRTRIARICETSARRPEDISIVAVTKGFGPEAINAAFAAQLTDIGENYYQEAAAKFSQVAWPPFPVRRHFIGRVQRNKARRIAALFDVVQTIQDSATAAILDAGAADAGKTLDVLIQANAAEDQRQGVMPAQLPRLAEQLKQFGHLRLCGLMVIGPQDTARAGEVFSRAAALYDTLQQSDSAVRMLSIGMSADMEAAVRAGTTMLRLGTLLFGDRPAKPADSAPASASMGEG